MEHGEDTFESSSSRDETVDLLEECWFYDNLLSRRTRMPRCYSDPCPSSNFCQEMLVRNSHSKSSSSKEKVPEDDGFAHRNLIRTPSLPPCVGREEATQGNRSNSRMSKSIQQSSRPNLHRTPSLPPCIGREEVIREKDHRMSKLNWQASASPIDILPPPGPSKGVSSNIPRNRRPWKSEVESMNTDGYKEMRRRFLNQRKMRKRLSDLEFEEVQGFKDLGFTFDQEDLSPDVINILPGLQERNQMDSNNDKVRRPYLSEAWLVQSHAPPAPNWIVRKSAEDMKAQLKLWARAVASNVRQEC